jgi:EXLDI family protein
LTDVYIYVYYTHMPNKTIYVSEKDATLFEQAKEIAGGALSSVIARALSEYVAHHTDRKKGMKDVSVKVGIDGAEREQRFVAARIGEWTGFSDDKEWFMRAVIYKTQKENWAVYLETICKASLLTNKKQWKESGDYLLNLKKSELVISQTAEDLKNKVPQEVYISCIEHSKREHNPVEYLDI